MTPTQLRFTPALWSATLEAMTPYQERRREGGCLLYGRRADDVARALIVGVPRQVNRARSFEIPADALAALNTRVPDDLIVVAQVHSHPGADTTHSVWDDTQMVSRRAFSLVLPHYAALPCAPDSAGVHIFNGSNWIKLSGAEAFLRIIVEEDPEALDVGSATIDMR